MNEKDFSVEFRDIRGFEGLYSVTSDGRVFSHRRGTFRRLRTTKKGYKMLGLMKDGKEKAMYVHRLVAEAFIPNPENKPQVNHINEDKADNRVENLEWATAYENMHHGAVYDRMSETVRNNIADSLDDDNNYTGFIANKIVRPVKCVETGAVYTDAMEAARELSLHRNHINDCCRGLRRTHGGYHWEYA